MKITFSKNENLISNENMIDILKASIKNKIKQAEDGYKLKRNQLFQNVLNLPKESLLNNITNLKQEIDSKYFITNNYLDYFQTKMINYL